jgi:hypothetical protein
MSGANGTLLMNLLNRYVNCNKFVNIKLSLVSYRTKKWNFSMTLSLRSLTLMARFSTCCYGQSYPSLAQAVSNNAVALVNTDNDTYRLSFMGLGTNKGYQDVHNLVCALALPLATC